MATIDHGIVPVQVSRSALVARLRAVAERLTSENDHEAAFFMELAVGVISTADEVVVCPTPELILEVVARGLESGQFDSAAGTLIRRVGAIPPSHQRSR